MNLFSDKVMQALFAFALGVVFTVIQCAITDTNSILVVLGIVWCLVSLYWLVREVKNDWDDSE
jgi:hypothetical protein